MLVAYEVPVALMEGFVKGPQAFTMFEQAGSMNVQMLETREILHGLMYPIYVFFSH